MSTSIGRMSVQNSSTMNRHVGHGTIVDNSNGNRITFGDDNGGTPTASFFNGAIFKLRETLKISLQL